jgi:hypothetical protein
VIDGEQAFVAVADWLGPAPTLPGRDVLLAELARRYLTSHGPAADRDLAKWSGLPLRDVRLGLAGLGGSLVEVEPGLVDLSGRPSSAPPLPPPLLLGAFDPLLLGWASRADVLGDLKQVVTTNGIFRPVILVNGQAVGTWGLPGNRVSLNPSGRLGREVRSALDAEAAAVERFLAPNLARGAPGPS